VRRGRRGRRTKGSGRRGGGVEGGGRGGRGKVAPIALCMGKEAPCCTAVLARY
jgi:hypothetical protein